ncbi:MAG: alpha/beta hydrolase [Bacteroidetes bacterium]|nr:alpha/beta hydrolase [Bacteroidota bacterium]
MRFPLLLVALLFPLSLFALSKDSTVFITAPEGKVFGTLTLPTGHATVPLAIIIAGSGPTDRNGNQLKLKNNSLLALGDSLAQSGVASLRYDKRGVAASKDAASDESKLRFDDYISDAEAWVRKYQHDKRFSQIFIIGHSEGALVGLLAAEKVNVAGYVSLAGVAVPVDSIIYKQIKALAAPNSGMPDSMRMLMQTLRSKGSIDSVPHGIYQGFFRKSVQPYLLSWMRYDPSVEIKKLKIPVLIIQGSTDIQVDTSNAYALKAAWPSARLVIIPGMNHVLKNVGRDPGDNQLSYMDPGFLMNKELTPAIVSFIRSAGQKQKR